MGISKLSQQPLLRSYEISDAEKQAAREAIRMFDKFLKDLWAARQHDYRLINVLKKNQGTSTEDLYGIRHLLRRFQREVKDRYTKLIIDFAGQKDEEKNMTETPQSTTGYVHVLKPLEKDTTTRQIKSALQDAMQQLTEFLEEFIEAFEDFGDPEQVNKIMATSDRADKIVRSIENIVDKQLKTHFRKNILGRKNASEIRGHILRRARLIKMMER
jgi:hypothetical protein